MSNTITWFERKFAFDLPAELLPQLLTRLRGTPARLEEMLRSFPRDLLIQRPGGKWSALEHAGHLLDLESLWIARLHDYVKGGEQLTPADLSNRRTHEANYNAKPLDPLLTEFRAMRGSLLQQISSIDSQSVNHVLPHPRLKTPMRLIDHLYFVAEHDDHHLARIWEIASAA